MSEEEDTECDSSEEFKLSNEDGQRSTGSWGLWENAEDSSLSNEAGPFTGSTEVEPPSGDAADVRGTSSTCGCESRLTPVVKSVCVAVSSK